MKRYKVITNNLDFMGIRKNSIVDENGYVTKDRSILFEPDILKCIELHPEWFDEIKEDEKKDWVVRFQYHNSNMNPSESKNYKTHFYNLTKSEILKFLEGNIDVLDIMPSITSKSEKIENKPYDLYPCMIKSGEWNLNWMKHFINEEAFTKEDIINYSEYRRRQYKSIVISEDDIFNKWLKERNNG